jgi:uncharacterized cupin superfamily protein
MNSNQPALQVVAFPGELPTPEDYQPATERVVSGDPRQRVWTLYRSADGRFQSGIWECSVGKWQVTFTESEFCQLLGGVIVMTAADGQERTVRAGDVFLVPAGFSGYWDVREPARKYYAVYE